MSSDNGTNGKSLGGMKLNTVITTVAALGAVVNFWIIAPLKEDIRAMRVNQEQSNAQVAKLSERVAVAETVLAQVPGILADQRTIRDQLGGLAYTVVQQLEPKMRDAVRLEFAKAKADGGVP